MRVKQESEKAGLKFNNPKTKIIELHRFTAKGRGKSGNNDILFSQAPKSLQMVTSAMKLKDTCSLEKMLCQT